MPRSRWQAVLLEAGGIGAAVSEESMRRLRYCLQWLQVCIFKANFHEILLLNYFFRTVRHRPYRRTNTCPS
jgi:hypothetical protein